MMIDPRAPQQRTGVLGSLNMSADSFRLLPKEDETSSAWTATQWAESRRGWIFITSRPTMREALRPLISLWIDTLVLRLLNEPMPDQKPVWFVIDELASLQRLPQLHTAITENRKSQNPVILGFQGRSQMEARYGQDAEAMLSQPATKIFLRTTEPRAAKWVSEAIGEVEIERLRETHYDGSRTGKNLALDRQTEPLVLPSEVSGLDDLRGFLKYGNHVARFSFPFIALREKNPGFDERKILALLVGCALRRNELAELDVETIQQREGRWVLADLESKGRRIRTVAIPIWVKQGIDAWMTAAGIDKGRLLRSISKSGKINRETLSDWAVWSVVEQSSKQIGIEHFGAHDLRRTCAKLCRKNGGDLEQIKFLLGHSSIQTTERYLGSEQDIEIAVNDNLGL
jgi:hypothetical protein